MLSSGFQGGGEAHSPALRGGGSRCQRGTKATALWFFPLPGSGTCTLWHTPERMGSVLRVCALSRHPAVLFGMRLGGSDFTVPCLRFPGENLVPLMLEGDRGQASSRLAAGKPMLAGKVPWAISPGQAVLLRAGEVGCV